MVTTELPMGSARVRRAVELYERRQAMLRRKSEGETLRAIAADYAVSVARVHGLIKEAEMENLVESARAQGVSV